MPQGLQVFAADGSVVLDTTTPVVKILGSRVIGNTSGSLVDERLAHIGSGMARLFTLLSPDTNSGSVMHQGPTMSLSGTTLSWTNSGASSASYFLVYGLY